MQKKNHTSHYLDSLEDKLKSSKFRWLNEKLYTSNGTEALKYFQSNQELFAQYHEGFSKQVELWPVNPLDLIINELAQLIQKRPKLLTPLVIADLGCGEGRLGLVLSEIGAEVHSFDLVAHKSYIMSADIANLPLQSNTMDIVVFCLSLMGSNWPDFITESLRVLKDGYYLNLLILEGLFT